MVYVKFQNFNFVEKMGLIYMWYFEQKQVFVIRYMLFFHCPINIKKEVFAMKQRVVFQFEFFFVNLDAMVTLSL